MNAPFEMVAKTFQGLEEVLAKELQGLGAEDVAIGKRMVSFKGDLELLYKANFCCRTALRILKPFYSFDASDPDQLYAKVKEYDWSTILSADQTFAIDSVVNSEDFKHSQYVTYRVKDGIVDRFRDREGDDKRPRVRLDGADIMINVHISGRHVTLSLDSSGESLHKRGWRVAQTEAPINEVLAAGIILMTGWDGTTPFVDPMCGSGTFVIEAAMIAAGIHPGLYRSHFAFENWPDFDPELFDKIYNDDSAERTPSAPIVAADIAPRALEIARENAKNAAVERYITFERRSISNWEKAPMPAGVLVTNPPYGKRIGSEDMNALYASIGSTLKHIFLGYHAWIIGYTDEYFHEIGLAPSQKLAVKNGGLDCELREYVIFEGSKRDFRAAGGRIKDDFERPERPERRERRERRDSFRDGKERSFRDRRDRRDDRERPARDGKDRSFRDRRDRRDDHERPSKPFGPRRPEREGRDIKPEAQGERRRSLNIIGRQPSISPDKEIVLNRPAWRKRKKDSDNTQNTEQ